MKTKELTSQEKFQLYQKGQYMFPAPPVCTANWDTWSWMNFIDKCGKWTPKKEEKP